MNWRTIAHSIAPVVLALAAPAAHAQGPPPTPVLVDAVRKESVQESRVVTGDVRAARRSWLAAEEPGLVLEIGVREGQSVAEGDVLARLDAGRLELQLATLAAELASSEASLEVSREEAALAERDLEILSALAERRAANPKELADARTQASVARARVDKAAREVDVIQARRAELADRVDQMTIRAPFDGVVVARGSEAGQWLGVGEPLVELVSAKELEAWLDVPQRFIAALAAGTSPLSLRVDATGEVIELSERRVVPDVDPRARTFRIVVPIDLGGRTLVPGMSVTAWVPTGEMADHLTVSKDAILRNETGEYLYVARGGGEGAPAQAMPLPVEVLFRSGSRAVVRAESLAPGDSVVVEGNERLFPMAPVVPMPAAAGDGSESGSPR